MLTTNRIRPRTSPWSLFNHIQREFSRELSDWFANGLTHENTAVDVWTKSDAAIVAFELPGRSPEDFDVSIHHNVCQSKRNQLRTIFRKKQHCFGRKDRSKPFVDRFNSRSNSTMRP